MADSAKLAKSVAGMHERASMRHNAGGRAWPLLCAKWLQNFTKKTPMKARLWCNLSFEPKTEKKPLCNENQLDILFILNLFRQSTSTCFGHILPIIRGYKLYMYNNLSWMTELYMYSNWWELYFEADWLLAGSEWNYPSAASQPKCMTPTNCCKYAVYTSWWWATYARNT
jgi:hypothetical protein